MPESDQLREENRSRFSPKAAYTRDIVIFVIIGLIAIKISVIPFLNHLDKVYSDNSKSAPDGKESFLLDEGGEGVMGNIVAANGLGEESLPSLESFSRKYELEIVSLKAAHSLEIAELRQEHTAQLEETRSRATISMVALEAKSAELEKCELLLSQERARVDTLIGHHEKSKKQSSDEL
jgi:hypothetical protein|eukprot:g1100.t1